MQEPDPRLVAAAAAGDDLAFADLVRHCQADVWRLLRHLVHDPDLAADLTQDTFVSVPAKLESFRYDGSFRAWILRIARNRAIDEQRRQAASARRQHALEAMADLDRQRGASTVPRLEIDEALASLGAAQREAFVLVEVFGFRYREVADICGTSEGTVKSRMYHARKNLIAWFQIDDGQIDLAEPDVVAKPGGAIPTEGSANG